MKKILFTNEQNIYKANLHCHTTLSDGMLSPKEIKDMYKAKGYSIVAFTDHNILKSHQYLTDDNFLAINACEVDINPQLTKDTSWDKLSLYHFNLYATSPDIVHTPPLPQMDYHDTEAINQYIADRHREGFLVSYNHPYWSLQTHTDYHQLKGCFAVEIYNHGCEVEGYYGYNPQVYDELLRQGNRLYCLSVDDNHNQQTLGALGFDSFGGFIYVNSKSLKYEDIMEALAKGNFYASQGPEIHEISLDGDMLTIRCSPVNTIVVYTQGRKCYVKTGEGLEGAAFQLSGNEGYVRVMCRDCEKNDTNSNAFWLE